MCIHAHTGLAGGWWVSGLINIGAITGSSFNDVEIELIDVKCCDYSDTGVGGSRTSVGYFINNNSTYRTSWSGNINVKMTGCRGNGINFPYGGNFNNFNLYELNNCYMINMLNVGKMGLMQHTTFYATSGFSAYTLLGISSTYQPYYSEMIDCACQTGSTFSTTASNTLYIDNATWIKSNGSITTSGLLTLNIDYGFPNKSLFTTLTNGQVVSWDGTNSRFINSTPSSGGTQLSLLSDVSVTPSNDNVLIYTTNGSLNKWTNYSISGATFNDTTKTITISSSGALSGLSDCTITTPSNNQLLQYNTASSKWINATVTSASSLSTLTDATITTPSNNQLLQYNTASSKWINSTVTIPTSLSSLSTDVNITTPSNNQLLQYNTASGKWINATVASGGGSMSTLTDCTINTPVNGNLLIYDSTSSKWLNSDSIPDNLLFVYDDGNNTRKMQFQLSGITAGNTRILTIPDASTTIVGTDNSQVLTYYRATTVFTTTTYLQRGCAYTHTQV